MKRLLLLALLLPALPARAAFEDEGAGARAAGMGNAFTAIADDAYAIHFNPAGLGLLGRPELAMAHTRHYMGLTDSSQLATSFLGYAHPLKADNGALGAAWQQFALDPATYREQTIYVSYGRPLVKDLGPGDLYAGVTAKYLYRSFGSFPEASNAMGGASGFNSVGADAALTGARSASAVDADLGFLYRFKQHYAVGLAVQHVNEPNVAFGSGESDLLARAISVGLAYRSLLSNIAVQVNTRKSPTGSQDLKLTTALERWFPKLLIGEFGLRGALALGSRDVKEVTTGLSYRTRRIQVDYGFGMPLGGVSSAGSHRVGFSVRFGKLSEQDESVVMILEAMHQLKSGVIPELRALGGPGMTRTQKASLEELVVNAQGLAAQARYRDASESMSKALTLNPGDAELLKYFGRLNFVAQPYPSLPRYKTDAADASLHSGIIAYLSYSDAEAVEKTAHALTLRPDDKNLDAFLTTLEAATGVKRPELPKVEPAGLKIAQLLTEAGAALEAGKYNEAVELSLKVLQLDPENLSAWENLGTAYFTYGDYANSLTAWEKALSLEKNAARRSAIKGTISSIQKLMSKPKPERVEGGQRLTVSPLEIQKLYNQGVDDYTAGRLEDARAAFQRVVDLDPAYVPAKKALRRVEEELSAR